MLTLSGLWQDEDFLQAWAAAIEIPAVRCCSSPIYGGLITVLAVQRVRKLKCPLAMNSLAFRLVSMNSEYSLSLAAVLILDWFVTWMAFQGDSSLTAHLLRAPRGTVPQPAFPTVLIISYNPTNRGTVDLSAFTVAMNHSQGIFMRRGHRSR